MGASAAVDGYQFATVELQRIFLGTDPDAYTALFLRDALGLVDPRLYVKFLAFGIAAPFAPQRAAFEEKLRHHFRDRALLKTALTHSSFANESRAAGCESNERLEFLGDSVLGMVVADALYRRFPDMPEGRMTRLRARLVCEESLHAVASELGLGGYMRLGRGEEHTGGRKRASILADAVESVLAAAYLDGGFSAASSLVHRFILTDIPAEHPRNVDYKTQLQELVQQKKDQVIQYELTGQSGPDHAKQFQVEVRLNGSVVGQGTGSSKKRAEQEAARVAMEKLFPAEL